MLEITERGLPDRIGISALEQASKLGVKIALDDVALSGSVLTVMLTLSGVDVIKLDRSLVAQITPECPCPDWLAGLSNLLQSNKLAVIAEGVETQYQAELLRKSGILMAQGYYFSRPLMADAFKAYHAQRLLTVA